MSSAGESEKQARRRAVQFDSLKITTSVALRAIDMPLDAHPVVEGLRRQMDVLRSFQFDHRKAAGAVDREQVKHPAIDGGKRWDVAVDGLGQELGVDFLDLRADLGFEPSFRVGEIKGGPTVGCLCGVKIGALLSQCYNFAEMIRTRDALSMDSEQKLGGGGASELETVYAEAEVTVR